MTIISTGSRERFYVTVHGIDWMGENVEPLSSIGHAPEGGKPTLAPKNWGQLFYIAKNGCDLILSAPLRNQ
jgi:hypothetical protein